MATTRRSRSIAATPEGLTKVQLRMAELEKSENLNADTPEKKRFSQEKLAEKAVVNISTVQRFLQGKPIDRNSLILICGALQLEETQVVDPREWNPPAPISTQAHPEINWREKCQEILETRRQLASNLFTAGTDIILNFNDIHVSLGLIERKEKPQPKNDCPPQEGSKVYGISKEEEKISGISSNEFLNNVLAKGNSPKSKGKRLSIVGEPGAGKTTQLLKIADWVLDKTEKLPVWVSLAEVGTKNLDDYLTEDWLNRAFGKTKATEIQAEFEQLLLDGKVWLLLDGADEMGMSDPLGKLAQSLRVAVFKNVPVVLSCRLNFWEAAANALFDFDTYKMFDFSYGEANKVDQVSLFINKWFSAPCMPLENQKLGGELRQALDEPGKERIKDLARNPLRLYLLCLTWINNKGKLPDTKAELYEEFVSALYELKKGIFQTDTSLRNRLNAALGQLGLKAIDAGYKSILPYEFVNEALEKPHPELFAQAIKLGWLNPVDKQNLFKSNYAFYHPTFQEYFAACEIEEGKDFFKPVIGNPQEGCYRIFEEQWREVFLLWLGRKDLGKEKQELGKKKKEELIEALWNFKDECDKFYWYRAVFLAAVGISEFKECALADKIVAEIVRWGFGYFNEQKQSWVTYFDPLAESAREIVKETHRQKAIDALVNLLSKTEGGYTDDWKVVNCLGEIAVGNQKAIEPLVDLLAKTSDENTRRRVVYCLGEIAVGDQKAIGAIVDFLPKTEDEATRRHVLGSLGKIAVGNQKAIDALVHLLTQTITQTKDGNTLWEVAYCLGKIDPGNKIAKEILLYLLTETKDEIPRRYLAKNLGEIDPGNPDAIYALVNLLSKAEDANTRWEVADCLDEIAVDNEKAIDTLVHLLLNTDKNIRTEVAYCLGKIAVDNEKAIDALVDLLLNTDENTCCDVAYCLGEIAVGNEKAKQALGNLLTETKDENTAWEVAYCLGKIAPGNKIAKDALAVGLRPETKDENTRCYLAYWLGEIDPGNPDAIDALLDLLLNTENNNTRLKVLKILSKSAVRNEKAIDAIVNLLPNTNKALYTRLEVLESLDTRLEVVYCLGEIAIDNPDAIDALVYLLPNTDESTRLGVVKSLSKITVRKEKAIDALVYLLANTENGSTGWLVAESLSKIAIGNPDAIDALVYLFPNTENNNTRQQVAYCLQQILEDKKQFQQVVTRLKNCLTSENHKSNDYLYKNTFKLLWHCAQNLTYPDFYTAWHYQPPTHPEMQDITGTGITAITQRYNLENLPQILTQTLNNNPQLNNKIKLLIIDASKFLDPENPASEIYDQMLDQNCPERQNGEPQTLQNLKTYCSHLRRQLQQNLVFIYYEKPSNPPPQGFSKIFLNDLTKFDTPVRILSEKTDIPLQTFNPKDPNLIQNIIGWITALVLEN